MPLDVNSIGDDDIEETESGFKITSKFLIKILHVPLIEDLPYKNLVRFLTQESYKILEII